MEHHLDQPAGPLLLSNSLCTALAKNTQILKNISDENTSLCPPLDVQSESRIQQGMRTSQDMKGLSVNSQEKRRMSFFINR